VRFARALGAELDQVVVALAERDQAHQLADLVALAEHLRVEAHALDQQVDPLVGGELLSSLHVPIEVEVRQLDWLDGRQDPRRVVLLLGEQVLQVSDAPHPTHQQLGVLLDRGRVDDDLLDA
jgi:hypothetical protein